MDDTCDDQWRALVRIHFATKRVTLCAEEMLDFSDHRTYIQPIREERDAFEHVCRAMANRLGIGKTPTDSTYINGNLASARKHAIRAFFDAADWYGTSLRVGIRKRLEPYSHSCIQAVLPVYYSRIRMRLDEIVNGIVQCRKEKDVSNTPGTLAEVDEYYKLIIEVEGLFKEVSAAIPYLETEDIAEKSRHQAQAAEQGRQRRAERPWSLVIGIAASSIVAVIVLLYSGYLLGRSSPPQPAQPGESTPAPTNTR